MERIRTEFLNHLLVFFEKVLDLIPDLLVMLVILAAGLLTAYVIRGLMLKVFKAVRFDLWCEEVGLTSMLTKSAIETPPGRLLSLFAYWLIIVSFFMAGLGSLGAAAREFTTVFFLYVPRLISALVVFAAGFIFAGFMGRAALLAAVSSGVSHSRLIGQSVRLALIAVVTAMALEQLSIAPMIVIAAFSIFFGAAGLAAGLAFGLGGREAARKIIEDLKEGEKRQSRDMDQL